MSQKNYLCRKLLTLLTKADFQNNLEKIFPDFQDKTFLLAVSGGADSMVLAHLFLSLKINFQVAHINYGLRGEASDLDEKLVKDFCERHCIKFHLRKVSDEESAGQSVQIWARNLRYDYFCEILEKENLDFIATAHHLNDDLETFLINLSRGSGIRGLCGIPADENRILRPLLPFTKQEIYDFAAAEKIDFREDLSNKKNDYLRNKFRNEVIPKMEDAAPDFLQNLKKSLEYLRATEAFVQTEIDKAFASVLIKEINGETLINKEKFFALKSFLRHEIILKFGFRGDEVLKIISAENGKMFRSKTYELYIIRHELIFRRR